MGILDGQVAIMTGGGTGIGRAAALMLAAEGAQVVVAGRRKAPIEAVAGEIAKAGGRAVARACDVAKPAKAGVLNLMGHVHNVLREKGIRATTIMPAEVDTPILDNRPLNPDAAARATMMHADDVARAIMLCVTLPPRTVIETMVMSPTILRDQSADLNTARDLGA